MDKEVSLAPSMETILLLAHTEADGSLAQSALEALGAAKALSTGMPSAKLMVGLVGQSVQTSANRIAGCGAEAVRGIMKA